MNNKSMPISAVKGFIQEALRRGCYNKNQTYNFETAWSVILKALPNFSLNEASPIEHLLPKVESILKEHGRNSSASAESIKAYQNRVERVLNDFLKYHEGDFMAWKEVLAKASTSDDTKARRRRRSSKPRPDNNEHGDGAILMVHRLIAGQGREGKIELPNDLSDEEVEHLWTQLEALKTLVKAQSAALSGRTRTDEKQAPQ